MITIKELNSDGVGFLGNKLFLVACAIGYAEKYNEEIILPLWLYQDIFKERIKTSSEVTYKTNWIESGFHYTEIPKLQDINLKGYFQSEKYFEHCKDKVRWYFRPAKEIVKQLQNKYDFENTVSIHVRRGDYVKHPNHHPMCTMEYYEKAIAFFPEKYKFIVVSNDIPWCRENFVGDRFLFSTYDSSMNSPSAPLDLFLQSFCTHNIIANSSFSWWGAWLNENPNKKVIVPEKWFGPAYDKWNTNDLIPEGWIKI